MLPTELLHLMDICFRNSTEPLFPVYILVYLCEINRDFVNNYIVYKCDIVKLSKRMGK